MNDNKNEWSTDIYFFITDTNYLHVYVPDNRYAEPIFIYFYKVNK